MQLTILLLLLYCRSRITLVSSVLPPHLHHNHTPTHTAARGSRQRKETYTLLFPPTSLEHSLPAEHPLQEITAANSTATQEQQYRNNKMMDGGSNSHMDMDMDKNTPPAADMAVEDVSPPASRQQKLIKAGLLSVLAVIVLYVVLDYTIPGLGFVADVLTDFLEWVEDNPGLGAVAFAAVYVFTTICFIPGSLLTLGAGLVFGRALGVGLGVVVGSVAVLAGATVGAILAFLLGRFVLREQAQGLFNKFKILKAVDRAIETQGLKLVLLLRLSPVVPFSVFNYVMGVTAVHFRDYAIGCLGMIPGTVAYVFIGTTASSLLGDDSEEEDDDDSGSSNVQLIVIIVGAIATVIAVVLISVYAKRALNKVLEEDMEAEERMANDAAGMESGGVTSVSSDDAQAQGASRPAALDYPVRAHA